MNSILTLLNDGFGETIVNSLKNLWGSTGINDLVTNFTTYGWQNLVMIAISCILFFLAIVKKFEPLLLLPIAFGMFIVNIPGVYHVLFGTKGYLVTENVSGDVVARVTLDELRALLNKPDASLEELTEFVKNGVTFMED